MVKSSSRRWICRRASVRLAEPLSSTATSISSTCRGQRVQHDVVRGQRHRGLGSRQRHLQAPAEGDRGLHQHLRLRREALGREAAAAMGTRLGRLAVEDGHGQHAVELEQPAHIVGEEFVQRLFRAGRRGAASASAAAARGAGSCRIPGRPPARPAPRSGPVRARAASAGAAGYRTRGRCRCRGCGGWWRRCGRLLHGRQRRQAAARRPELLAQPVPGPADVGPGIGRPRDGGVVRTATPLPWAMRPACADSTAAEVSGSISSSRFGQARWRIGSCIGSSALAIACEGKSPTITTPRRLWASRASEIACRAAVSASTGGRIQADGAGARRFPFEEIQRRQRNAVALPADGQLLDATLAGLRHAGQQPARDRAADVVDRDELRAQHVELLQQRLGRPAGDEQLVFAVAHRAADVAARGPADRRCRRASPAWQATPAPGLPPSRRRRPWRRARPNGRPAGVNS